MAKKKESAKVVNITDTKPQPRFLFPEGDPRNNMTPEEIEAIAQREAQDIESRLSKFILPTTNDPGIEDEEEDGEEEIVTVDLEKKVVGDKVTDVIIIKPDNIVSSDIPNFDKHLEEIKNTPLQYVPQGAPQVEILTNPYTQLITDLFVRKAIASLIAELNDYHDKLSDIAFNSPIASLAEGTKKEVDKLWDDKAKLRLAIQGNKVDYNLIPEWAVGNIESFISRKLTDLILFAE